MRTGAEIVAAVFLSGASLCGCGGGAVVTQCQVGCGGAPPPSATPNITTVAAQNGAVIVSLTSNATGATILYTVDGSLPDQYSSETITYEAPFLVASNLTVKAVAIAP
ncbi:MAG: chitobiase/beta-hexosaminidase C-terminal domain-containing protein, partial [Terracidiphilus sp.]